MSSFYRDSSRSDTDYNNRNVVIAQGQQQVRDKLQYGKVVIAQGQQQVRDKQTAIWKCRHCTGTAVGPRQTAKWKCRHCILWLNCYKIAASPRQTAGEGNVVIARNISVTVNWNIRYVPYIFTHKILCKLFFGLLFWYNNQQLLLANHFVFG